MKEIVYKCDLCSNTSEGGVIWALQKIIGDGGEKMFRFFQPSEMKDLEHHLCASCLERLEATFTVGASEEIDDDDEEDDDE